MAKNIRKTIKKIPGYGSGNIHKMMLTTLCYAGIFFILFVFFQVRSKGGSPVITQEVTPLALEWGIIIFLAIILLLIHLRKRWKK